VYAARNIVVICAVGTRKSANVHDVYEQLSKLAHPGRFAARIQVVFQNMLKSQCEPEIVRVLGKRADCFDGEASPPGLATCGKRPLNYVSEN
jgi:hypothetical protein